MKKIISLLFAIMLVFSISAFADVGSDYGHSLGATKATAAAQPFTYQTDIETITHAEFQRIATSSNPQTLIVRELALFGKLPVSEVIETENYRLKTIQGITLIYDLPPNWIHSYNCNYPSNYIGRASPGKQHQRLRV